jgi:hypothetical protein
MSGDRTGRRAVKILWRTCGLAALFGLSLAVSSLSSAAEKAAPADAVFLNGKVFTAIPRAPMAEAFAVKGERFFAVGTSAAMRGYVGPNTVITELHGRLVTWGLADGHFHNEGGGPHLDLSQTRSLGDLFAAVSKAARAAGPGAIIVSNPDWHEAQLREKRLPLARELDAAAPDNPVVLVRGGHEMIVNGAALAVVPPAVSLDHLVGAGEERWRNVEAERLRCLKVDHQLELGRLLDRQLCRVGAV